MVSYDSVLKEHKLQVNEGLVGQLAPPISVPCGYVFSCSLIKDVHLFVF